MANSTAAEKKAYETKQYASKTFPTTGAIKGEFNRLVDLVLEFNKIWPENIIQAEAFPIPLYGKNEDSKAVIPDIISPEAHYSGDDAVELMKRALIRFDAKGEDSEGEQAPTSVYRLPSLVVVENLRLLKPMIDEINKQKDRIKEMVCVYEPGGRRAIVREAMPYKSALQVYRHINTISGPVVRIGFSWTQKAVSSKKLSYAEAVEYLQKGLDERSGDDLVAYEKVVNSWLTEISQFPGRTFVVRRKLAPIPRIKAKVLDSENNEQQVVLNAAIPLFLDHPTTLTVSPLGALDQSKEAHSRRIRQPAVSVVPDADLFVLVPKIQPDQK